MIHQHVRDLAIEILLLVTEVEHLGRCASEPRRSSWIGLLYQVGVQTLSDEHLLALAGAVVGLVALRCNDPVPDQSLKVHCEGYQQQQDSLDCSSQPRLRFCKGHFVFSMAGSCMKRIQSLSYLLRQMTARFVPLGSKVSFCMPQLLCTWWNHLYSTCLESMVCSGGSMIVVQS